MPLDNDSYLRAQRQYDAQEAPDYYEKTPPDYIDVKCKMCNGNGCILCAYTGEVKITYEEWLKLNAP